MDAKVLELWPEIEWIQDKSLREQTAKTWELALERSVLTPNDLKQIPFTLLCGPDLKVTFMDHKRSVVHIARDAGNKMNEMYHGELPVDIDVLISDLVYYYCIKHRLRLSRKAFAKRKPNKLINVTMTRKNSTLLAAYANTIGIDYNTMINQIIKRYYRTFY